MTVGNNNSNFPSQQDAMLRGSQFEEVRKPTLEPDVIHSTNVIGDLCNAGLFEFGESASLPLDELLIKAGLQSQTATESKSAGDFESLPATRVPSDTAESVQKPVSLPGFDLLAKTFLSSVTRHLANRTKAAISLLVVTRSGKLVDFADHGFPISIASNHRELLKKIARECAFKPLPRASVSAMVALQPRPLTNENVPSTPSLECEPIAGSVLLNELSQAIGKPMVASPIPLSESAGLVVILSELPQIPGLDLGQFVTDASQLWMEPAQCGLLVRHLDAWSIVQRSSGYLRTLRRFDAIRARPRLWISILSLLSVALIAPVPYYPRRECVFEPEMKQFLASPMQGRLASCNVRPGDRVTKDQVLAKLDDDQLQRELAAARADFDGAEKKRDAALATRSAGNAGIADIEMEQARLKMESLQEQLKRLEIRAIAEGVVIQGDWQRSVGTPVTLGQNLFEVAELESMTAEVRLNAFDLEQINVGDEVSIRSDASGGKTFVGRISRIEPRAEIVDDSAIFVADVVIRDPLLQLRPGMKAMAQVKAGWKSVGWLLFSRPYRWIANQWIW
jgi:hypothetical protein